MLCFFSLLYVFLMGNFVSKGICWTKDIMLRRVKSTDRFLVKFLFLWPLNCYTTIRIEEVKIFYFHINVYLLGFCRVWRTWSPAIRVTSLRNFSPWRNNFSSWSRLFLRGLLKGLFLGELKVLFAEVVWRASKLFGFAFFMGSAFSLHFSAWFHIL